jgi:pimeloyl-ACP methyl ester carboxylesterase
MTTLEDTLGSDDYDEFVFLSDDAAEWDIPFDRPPTVARHTLTLPTGENLSYLRWGHPVDEPELVLLHGSAQNAHTWDAMLLALGRPAVAVDLPGHGRSDRRADHDYGPWRNAEAVAALIEAVAPTAYCVVGSALGGVTTIRLAAQRPDLCRRAVTVDATPRRLIPLDDISDYVLGPLSLALNPRVYDTFDEMAEAAVVLSPYRTGPNVRRAVRHNARRLDDGRWTWSFDSFRTSPECPPAWLDASSLWEDVSAITVPLLLVRGSRSPFVRDEDVAEMLLRLPTVELAAVEDAGHSVQSHRPLSLAGLVRAFALPTV